MAEKYFFKCPIKTQQSRKMAEKYFFKCPIKPQPKTQKPTQKPTHAGIHTFTKLPRLDTNLLNREIQINTLFGACLNIDIL